MPPPRVFLSYSWTNEAHQDFIRQIAERLVSDGIEIVMDIYDLREGDDKYAYMERMVTDAGITHVLVFCDKLYAEKADARQAGVGTESQILSKELYEKVQQSKIVPIVCEFAADRVPTLPVFFATRKWIDFSSDDAVSRNWEQLIRLIFGKPLHTKPDLGKPPTYITDDFSAPLNPARAKYNALKQAILQGKPARSIYRKDLLEACIVYADAMRIRAPPQTEPFGKKVLEDCGTLVLVRDCITDWVLLESEATSPEDFAGALTEFLERLLALKGPPPGLAQWNDLWFEAHQLFVYETFLYIVAALLKTRSFLHLRNVFQSRYLVASANQVPKLSPFSEFMGFSQLLNAVLRTDGRQYNSPAAELIKRQAQRADLPFKDIMQAELLVFMVSCLSTDLRWVPQTLLYVEHGTSFPLFLRSAQHNYFVNLSTVTGVSTGDALRSSIRNGLERLQVGKWMGFYPMWDRYFLESMNLERLDTIQ